MQVYFKIIAIPYYLRKFYLIAFLTLLRNITTIGYHVDTHRVAKRMDLELCLGRFDVHHDTIIRTEESQSIGGKYLQGVGLETLEECQRLCCESEGCDVFIFEEKGEGYCYLFECGPPENFRCKFTRHANYTSAVLTPIRHVTSPPTIKPKAPLNTQLLTAGLSQHELELTNLKQKPEAGIQQRKATTTLMPPLGGRIGGGQATTPKNAEPKISSCRRFQFQCHSGECIAVYNACDGIPQCEDGSDEGPECPATSPVGPKISALDGKNIDAGNVPIPNVNRDAILTNQIQIQRNYQQQAMQSPPIINNREDPMSAPQSWPNQNVQDVQHDIDHNSHIFSHKGGLQIASNNIGQQFPNQSPSLYGSLQRDIYMQPDMQDSYHNVIIQPQDNMIVPSNINWQQQVPQQQQSLLSGNQYIIHGQSPVHGKQIAITQQETPQLVPAQTRQNDESKIVAPTPASNKSKHDEVKHSHRHSESGESDEYDDYGEKSTEPPKKKQRKHKKNSKEGKNKSKKDKNETPAADSPVHEQYKMIKNNLEMEFVDHDGQSERPGGAVLSLTLGIIVTAALAVLVGCRMRTVGRRIRRNGKAPYAHDADFLVNGMYL